MTLKASHDWAPLSSLLNALDRITQAPYSRVFFPHDSWAWGNRVADYGQGIVSSANIQVIIATHPFLGTLRGASLLAERSGLPWIADMRDPLHNDPQLRCDWIRKRLLPLEQAILQKAASVVTINRCLAGMLATSKDVQIIPNCYDDPLTRTHSVKSDLSNSAPLEIAYTGAIFDNHRYRELFDSLLAMPHRRGTEALLRFSYYGRSYDRLAPYVDRLKAKGIELTNCGFVSAQECLQAQARSDLLLVFGWRGIGCQCVMTGKVFDYLAAGQPIIAVTERSTALAELIDRTGAGIVLDSGEETQRFFSNLRQSKVSELHRLEQGRKPHVIREYSATETAHKYEELLRSVVK